MFENLSDRLGRVVQNLRGQGRITEDNIKDTMREVRMALLEADVALPVVKEFVEDVKAKALGEEVMKSLTPGQALVKIVNDELIKVMVVSADVYRPAAIDQLETLAKEVGVEFFPSDAGQKPEKIASQALDAAKKGHFDVLIVDTAGRLHIDEAMMEEIKALHRALQPVETLFVVDAMTGQDAANTARAFNEALPLTGVVLTKIDGDARGGAALSIGVGEKTTALEAFHPDRIASRILGMGDVVSLVEEISQKVDQDKAAKLARKIHKGKGFTLSDFKEQMEQMSKMGGVSSMMDKLPGMGQVPDAVKAQAGDKEIRKMIAIVNSMTPQEREFPQIIKGSRKRRIARGSGTQVQDVNRMLKQFTQMQKMMKKVKSNQAEAVCMKNVKEILEQKGGEVYTVSPDETVLEAIRKLADLGIGSLVVVENGKPVGLFSERDYTCKVALEGKHSKERLVVVRPDTTTNECMALMTENRIRHLPVVEEGKLVGLVSIGDIVKDIISEQQFVIEQLEQYLYYS